MGAAAMVTIRVAICVAICVAIRRVGGDAGSPSAATVSRFTPLAVAGQRSS
jgi:hypothetical protein